MAAATEALLAEAAGKGLSDQGIEVAGVETLDQRLARQQREAEKAGQVVDCSGDDGAAAGRYC